MGGRLRICFYIILEKYLSDVFPRRGGFSARPSGRQRAHCNWDKQGSHRAPGICDSLLPPAQMGRGGGRSAGPEPGCRMEQWPGCGGICWQELRSFPKGSSHLRELQVECDGPQAEHRHLPQFPSDPPSPEASRTPRVRKPEAVFSSDPGQRAEDRGRDGMGGIRRCPTQKVGKRGVKMNSNVAKLIRRER